MVTKLRGVGARPAHELIAKTFGSKLPLDSLITADMAKRDAHDLIACSSNYKDMFFCPSTPIARQAENPNVGLQSCTLI